MGKFNVGKIQRSKKHKKIKYVDPFYTGKRGENRIDINRINERPSNPDEQEIPRSLKEMMKSKDRLKMRPKKNRSKENRRRMFVETIKEDTRGATRKVKRVPRFEQGKKETNRAFYLRMERETQKAIKTVEFEEKFQVDVEDTGHGKIKIKKRKSENKVRKRKEVDIRKKEKKLQQKEKKLTGFEHLQDSITFGEVAQAPPTLTAKPRKADKKTSKPGKKSLLLHDIIQANNAQNPDSTAALKARRVGKTTKRKKLSMAQKVIMDAERDRAIELYRKMRKKTKLLGVS